MLGKTGVRLPGFRPGKIPIAVLRKRYGARARAEAINRIVAEATPTALPLCTAVVSSFVILAGVESGDLEFEAAATYLPDLPPVDFSGVTIERTDRARLWSCPSPSLKLLQVLDHLDGDLFDTSFAVPDRARVQRHLPECGGGAGPPSGYAEQQEASRGRVSGYRRAALASRDDGG